MKPRLLILSDIFGGENPEWIKKYTVLLHPKFEIQYYDVLKLATIDSANLIEADIHNQFLNGGIDKAIKNLLQLETVQVMILGFSIGGTIAWQASLRGLKTDYLFAISSTRLRYEDESPACNIKVYFGEKDLNKPNPEWFLNLNISNEILENQRHQFYTKDDNVSKICDDILNTSLK